MQQILKCKQVFGNAINDAFVIVTVHYGCVQRRHDVTVITCLWCLYTRQRKKVEPDVYRCKSWLILLLQNWHNRIPVERLCDTWGSRPRKFFLARCSRHL